MGSIIWSVKPRSALDPELKFINHDTAHRNRVGRVSNSEACGSGQFNILSTAFQFSLNVFNAFRLATRPVHWSSACCVVVRRFATSAPSASLHGMDPPADDVLEATVLSLLQGRDLTAVSLREFRLELETTCGLEAGCLDNRKEEVRAMIMKVMASIEKAPAAVDAYGDDLGDEPIGTHKKMVYLITFSRPRSAAAADGTLLRPPSDFTREQIGAAVRHALLASQQGVRQTTIGLVWLAVFLEQHSDGDPHFHTAVKASGQFRFLGVKAKLLQLYGLCSHWSVTHAGYASATGYCYLPSPRKPLSQLDTQPFLWASDGAHPPLEIATREAVSANALACLRENVRRVRAEGGKEEQRFTDVDVWTVVVANNIARSAVGREQLMIFAKAHGGAAMVKYLFTNWAKVPELIDRAWQVEGAEETVAEHGLSRVDYLDTAAQSLCVCGGRWRRAADDLFARNGLDATVWATAVRSSMINGRQKGNTVCHAGFEGDEGKSFLLQPLATVFGEDKVAYELNGFVES
jgi:hypothetical protein